MDSLAAFAMGTANRGKELMVFDWAKALRLLEGATRGEAWLSDDWEWTAGDIWADGVATNGGAYISSTWAKPMLSVDGVEHECWLMESASEYGPSHTWPESLADVT